jgi:large subunit ribosomal protein L32|tara:strand:- start:3563 stop:3745 length:183 start_codon:yes stop_codon:yes gene_type:complete
MAVPKKRTSRSKKNSRRATWVQKANKQAKKAFSLANSVLSGKSTSFVYNLEKSEQSSGSD